MPFFTAYMNLLCGLPCFLLSTWQLNLEHPSSSKSTIPPLHMSKPWPQVNLSITTATKKGFRADPCSPTSLLKKLHLLCYIRFTYMPTLDSVAFLPLWDTCYTHKLYKVFKIEPTQDKQQIIIIIKKQKLTLGQGDVFALGQWLQADTSSRFSWF